MVAYNKFMKEVKFEESWNKKRIGLALIFFLLLAAGAVYLFKDNLSFNTKPQRVQDQKVVASSQDLENIIQGQVQAIKQQAVSINVEEIASSSPQIQNLINDLKALQNLPSSRVKEACYNICKGL